MRSIDLTSIPKKGQFYDWMRSVGCICHIIWDGVELDFMIIDVYRKNRATYLKIISNHRNAKEVYDIDARNFAENRFHNIIKNNIYDVGDIINGKMLVEDVFTDDSNEGRLTYKIRCTSCGHTFKRRTDSFEKGKKLCQCCDRNHVVKKGINDIATKRPDLVKYFCNKEDAYRYSVSSNVKIKAICPICKTTKEIEISKLSSCGLSCPTCGDGVSFPNKFMRNLLNNCGIDFIAEYCPDWSNGRKYDFYLIKENIIIEMDGGQHFKDVDHWGGIDDTIKNDEYKTNMAIEHGIKIIRINCNYTNIRTRFEEIRRSVENSDISNIIDFKNKRIDWAIIEFYSSKSDLVRACEIKNEKPNFSSRDISCIIGVHYVTIERWLELGNKFGLCVYNKEAEKIKAKKEISKKSSKPLLFVEKGILYRNSNECGKDLGIKTKIINLSCSSKKPTRGLHFKYLKDLTPEEFTYYNCEQWLKDNDLWDIFVLKNKVV